jgi:hypothetical protein
VLKDTSIRLVQKSKRLLRLHTAESETNAPMPSASKPRARLSERHVITIFQAKSPKTSASTAAKVARVYGVSEKAIRDIWTGRTWSRETWHLDKSRPLQLKLTGRPRGCRDTKPRKKRVLKSGVAGRAFEQDALKKHADRMAGLEQSSDSAACFEDSSTGHPSRAAWRTSSTPCHASVDEQLQAWDAFWRTSTSADPFSGDWTPF